MREPFVVEEALEKLLSHFAGRAGDKKKRIHFLRVRFRNLTGRSERESPSRRALQGKVIANDVATHTAARLLGCRQGDVDAFGGEKRGRVLTINPAERQALRAGQGITSLSSFTAGMFPACLRFAFASPPMAAAPTGSRRQPLFRSGRSSHFFRGESAFSSWLHRLPVIEQNAARACWTHCSNAALQHDDHYSHDEARKPDVAAQPAAEDGLG
jgi:hypothetical protein